MTYIEAFALAILISSTAAIPAALAASPKTGNGFIDIKAGSAIGSLNRNYSQNESAFSYSVQGGYRWSLNAAASLGVELGYIDFGSVGGSNTLLKTTLDAHAVTVGGTYQLLFGTNDNYFFGVRAGYLHWSGQSAITANCSCIGKVDIPDSGDGDGTYLGASIGRFFTPHFGLSLNLDTHQVYVHKETVGVDVYTVGAEYRF